MGELSEAKETLSASETEQFGAELADSLRGGDVVLVTGDLGTGKTTLVRGALRALGVVGPVTSPSFVIGILYEGRELQLAHLDLYRLDGQIDEDPGLFQPYFGSKTITFIEWPQVGVPVWEDEVVGRTFRLALEHAGQDRRRIEVGR